MSLSTAIVEGRRWAAANPAATKTERDARIAKFRAAWGDTAAHGFWRGATEAL